MHYDPLQTARTLTLEAFPWVNPHLHITIFPGSISFKIAPTVKLQFIVDTDTSIIARFNCDKRKGAVLDSDTSEIGIQALVGCLVATLRDSPGNIEWAHDKECFTTCFMPTALMNEFIFINYDKTSWTLPEKTLAWYHHGIEVRQAIPKLLDSGEWKPFAFLESIWKPFRKYPPQMSIVEYLKFIRPY